MSFDNLINKFKDRTKQAADQMSKAAKIAKLKMDILTLVGEKTRHLQTIGQCTYAMFCDNGVIDGTNLVEETRGELSQIERIEARIRELEAQIADLQALVQQLDVKDVTEETQEAE
jgi:cell division protein FtsB